MTEDEIQRLADLIFDRMMEKQEQADVEYAEQIQQLYKNGYVISDITDKLGMNEEEKLVGELAKLQTMMMILEEKEEYENIMKLKMEKSGTTGKHQRLRSLAKRVAHFF